MLADRRPNLEQPIQKWVFGFKDLTDTESRSDDSYIKKTNKQTKQNPKLCGIKLSSDSSVWQDIFSFVLFGHFVTYKISFLLAIGLGCLHFVSLI